MRVGLATQSGYFLPWPTVAHGQQDRASPTRSRAALRCKHSLLVCTQHMHLTHPAGVPVWVSISSSSPATRRSATGATALRLSHVLIVRTSVACLHAASLRNLR